MTSPLERLQEMLDAALATHPEPASVDLGGRVLDERLHGYQRRAVAHLHDNPRAGLFMAMGLGKTASVLQALTPDHLPVLVVGPKRVAEHVWPVEVPKWRPDLSVAVASGTPAKRAAALASGSDIVAIGRDNIKDVKPGQFKTVVLDELSGYKNRGSQRWKMARKITEAAAYVWGLTGTPAPNGMMDLWAQAFLLDRGSALETTLTKYRARYFSPGNRLPNGIVTEWRLVNGAQRQIEERLAPTCLSMRAVDHLDLPPVTINRVAVPLPPAADRAYAAMAQDLVVQIEDNTHTADNAAVLTGKLSQITAGFLYGEEGEDTTEIHTEKVSAASEIIDGTGSPVLVFYRFQWEKKALLQAIPGARTVDEKGVIEQWNRGEVPVLLAHPASAGHGLNLQTGGHTIVWTSLPDWNLELWEQANARLARQGQTHPVVIHVLLSPDTVDEAMLARLQGKATLQEAVMMALRAPPSPSAKPGGTVVLLVRSRTPHERYARCTSHSTPTN